LSNDNKEVEWDIVNLCDEKAIKGLLKYRYQFKTEFDIGAVCVYADLDLLISGCGFNERTKKILELYQLGYTELDIADSIGVTDVAIFKILKTCVAKIINQSKQNWLYEYIYWDKLPTNENWKQCTRCKTFKQESQFGMDGRNKDGFKNYCHKCDK